MWRLGHRASSSLAKIRAIIRVHHLTEPASVTTEAMTRFVQERTENNVHAVCEHAAEHRARCSSQRRVAGHLRLGEWLGENQTGIARHSSGQWEALHQSDHVINVTEENLTEVPRGPDCMGQSLWFLTVHNYNLNGHEMELEA